MDQSTLDAFLQTLLSEPGAGILLWLIVGAVLRALPDLPSNTKFWFALVCAFIIPPAAYGLRVWLGYDAFTWEGLLLMVGIGFTVSQGVQRGTQQIERALAAN